jgi:hypothetical protein
MDKVAGTKTIVKIPKQTIDANNILKKEPWNDTALKQ